MRVAIRAGMAGTRRPGARGNARPEQTSRETREIIEWRRDADAEDFEFLEREVQRLIRGDMSLELDIT